MKWMYSILGNKHTLWLLFIVNLVGTAYGYYWYRFQLAETPNIFLPFVPDSPTASLFFTIVLFAFLLKKNWPYIEALAIITLFKYGVWAVVMNALVLIVTGNLDIYGYMLIFSHGAMAVQGLLYAPFYRMKLRHLVLASIWTLHNDVIDYVFFMLPSYQMLDLYTPQIGYFTFWLTMLSIAITYYLTVKKDHFSLKIF
ncbi:DUF1405 domain-containing protein [Bacillus sp. 03113]|uniref:DUF1405 domain-containing protein n=1 Tax=Bacillus sp. 03113 TaxID=2578211 RepID=UPI00114237FB|nr:DUF1405 domain-containing protein [Bacillus sp. 03113]